MNFIALMRGFTIRTRMYSAIGVVLSLLVMVGGVGMYGLMHNADASRLYHADSINEIDKLSRLRDALDEVRLHEKDILLMAGDAAGTEAALNAWRGDIDKLAALAQGASAQTLSGELAQYQQAFEAQLSVVSDVATPRKDALAALAPALASAERLGEQLNTLSKGMSDRAGESMAQQERTVEQTMAMLACAVVLSLLIVAPTTILNQIGICRPIDQARQLAISIAQGNLNNTVENEGRDEASELLRTLDNMQHALRDIVTNVRVTADSIAVASSQIASGNMDLSSRTESTASSLQQTSNSMEQLTGTVQHSAESARQANALAQGAATAAHRGNSIVTEVVSNMDEIDSTSKRINDIIGVIDGIAFQTNILALNAAVEAARAGEQGRGFAVVAGEVRSLAQRSATAAREIKQLILASGEKVASGTRLVHDAGTAMQEIITSVQRVSDIIDEISSASTQQSQGIGQVNQAVSDLDHMTQQNAALVEQSAAAAASLKDQAQSLTQAMAAFHM